MKKSVILFIDTSKRETVKISLIINGKETYFETSSQEKAQVALSLIEKIIKKSGLKLSDITGIKVNQGPGSFVGLRVGVSIANTLSFLLKVPVNGKNSPVEPFYD